MMINWKTVYLNVSYSRCQNNDKLHDVLTVDIDFQ